MNKLKYIFFTIFITVSSCGDDCGDVLIGESFRISDSTLIHLSNYFNSERVIFISTSNDEEVIFQITEKLISESGYGYGVECQQNPEEMSSTIGTFEYRQIVIQNTALELTFTIQHLSAIQTPINPNAVEEIFIMEGELNGSDQILSAESGLLVVTPTLDVPLFTTVTDVLLIAGKEFRNVEEINSINSGFDDDFISSNLTVGYNADNGIVFIKDNLTNSELVFERYE